MLDMMPPPQDAARCHVVIYARRCFADAVERYAMRRRAAPCATRYCLIRYAAADDIARRLCQRRSC